MSTTYFTRDMYNDMMNEKFTIHVPSGIIEGGVSALHTSGDLELSRGHYGVISFLCPLNSIVEETFKEGNAIKLSAFILRFENELSKDDIPELISMLTHDPDMVDLDIQYMTGFAPGGGLYDINVKLNKNDVLNTPHEKLLQKMLKYNVKCSPYRYTITYNGIAWTRKNLSLGG